MGKLAETWIRTNEGMGYVPCYQLPAFFSFFLLITFCGLLVTVGASCRAFTGKRYELKLQNI